MNLWKAAIGLQDVDGLEVSEYLIETAKKHIEGSIDIHEAKDRINRYYEAKTEPTEREASMEEADKVSIRIVELLTEDNFNFSKEELFRIHKALFTDLYFHAGKIRSYNITKNEWVLNGASAIYTLADSIKETLDYDFSQERTFTYKGLSPTECVKHLAKFTAGVWQIHPFGEGNTRTTAVFIIKYLRTMGFDVDIDVFASNSRYFRNALVRANYSDYEKGIDENREHLERFFENLILGAEHELNNETMVV